MLTVREASRIAFMKAATLCGGFVSEQDKQWILDIARREQIPVPACAVHAAKEQGYRVADVVLDYQD